MARRSVGLALLTVVAIAVVAYGKKPKPSTAADQRQRALHALDRLTFGPRPGDVDAVLAIGVDKWIDQQLHPERIDDSAIEARLSGYRTLQMSAHEMALAFPPNPVAKAVMDGKMAMPQGAYERAIYAAAIDRAEQRQEKKQEAVAAQPGAGNAQKPPAPADSARDGAAVQPPDVNEKQMARRDTHTVVDDLISLPPDARMNRILRLPIAGQHDILQGIPYPKRQALLAGLNPQQRETLIALNHPEGVVDQEVQSAKLLRAVYSQRQLDEVLTDFWFNHFNIFIGKGADRYLVTEYERDVIRPHVLGKFKDLLIATAQSPAMLFYLDNWQSEGPNSDAALGRPSHPPGPRPYARRPWLYPPAGAPGSTAQRANLGQKPRGGLNENYARELMELHTLGVNGGYTQHDVTEVARVFTGWTIDEPQRGGSFVFRPRLHEPGPKTVLGHKIKDGGQSEGMEVLNLLARQPATAHFISTELAQRFVSDNPPPALVDAMAETYLKTDGDIREVLRTMLASPEFWTPDVNRARVKTPLEFVASSLRATQAEVTDPLPLMQTLNKMGQQLYGCQPPTGYSTKSDVWVNSAALLDRMNFGLALVSNKLQGTSFDIALLMNAASAPASSAPAGRVEVTLQTATAPANSASGLADDPYEAQLKLEQALLAGNVSKQTHETIEQRIVAPETAAEAQPGNHPPNINVIAGLLLGSPEFQRK